MIGGYSRPIIAILLLLLIVIIIIIIIIKLVIAIIRSGYIALPAHLTTRNLCSRSIGTFVACHCHP
jgi:hypothetical protein